MASAQSMNRRGTLRCISLTGGLKPVRNFEMHHKESTFSAKIEDSHAVFSRSILKIPVWPLAILVATLIDAMLGANSTAADWVKQTIYCQCQVVTMPHDDEMVKMDLPVHYSALDVCKAFMTRHPVNPVSRVCTLKRLGIFTDRKANSPI